MKIRPATPADAATIAVFNIRMARETEDLKLDPAVVERGVRAALLDPAKGRYFVAESDGIVVGCLLLTLEWSDWRDGWIWWIQSVYIHPDYRRQGAFTALYDHVRSEARTQQVRSLRLYVEHDNANAQATYTKLGMKLSGYLVMEEAL